MFRFMWNTIKLSVIMMAGMVLLPFVVLYWVIRAVCWLLAWLIRICSGAWAKEQKIQKDFTVIDGMSGQQFERYIAQILLKLGYQNIQLTKTSGDYGVDIIANKGEIRWAFQCKRYANKLGLKPIQEVHAGMAHYGASIAVVVTNNYFTNNAEVLASETGVHLWDRRVLTYMLNKIAEAERKAELDKLAAEEQKKNEKAYKKMKWRNRVRGFFGVKIKKGHFDDVETPPQIGVVEDEEI